MITLLVHAFSGHYKVAGQVGMQQVAISYPVAPPSTMRGFLESLVGAQRDTFDGEFAYGYLRPPGGHGLLYRKSQVWSSDGIKAHKGAKGESIRPFHVETYFDLEYIVIVKGPWTARVQEALEGKVDRYGVLYLGSSDDVVTWAGKYDGPLDGVQWVVPGDTLPLTVHAPFGYDKYGATFGTFDMKSGEPHFFGAP